MKLNPDPLGFSCRYFRSHLLVRVMAATRYEGSIDSTCPWVKGRSPRINEKTLSSSLVKRASITRRWKVFLYLSQSSALYWVRLKSLSFASRVFVGIRSIQAYALLIQPKYLAGLYFPIATNKVRVQIDIQWRKLF